jgi:hypothetical protein
MLQPTIRFSALMFALAFTLSALPGINSVAEVGNTSLSSSSCNLLEELAPPEVQSHVCRITATPPGANVAPITGIVVATKVQIQPRPTLVDSNPPLREGVKAELQLEVGQQRTETVSLIIYKEDYANINTKVSQFVATHAAELANQMRAQQPAVQPPVQQQPGLPPVPTNVVQPTGGGRTSLRGRPVPGAPAPNTRPGQPGVQQRPGQPGQPPKLLPPVPGQPVFQTQPRQQIQPTVLR